MPHVPHATFTRDWLARQQHHAGENLIEHSCLMLSAKERKFVQIALSARRFEWRSELHRSAPRLSLYCGFARLTQA